ncbi:MAG: hypothetical protein N4A37_13640 [Prolixibacteraceae bacterium]|nr:hypothetical protein [Prolixibacteraceae bacterium]
MKKILYILMLSIVFTACETDVKNWIETDDGTAVTNFVYQPDSPLAIDIADYANLDYRYDLNVITQMDGWQSVKVNISFVDGITKVVTTKHFTTVMPSKTMGSITYEQLVLLFGERVNKDNIQLFDKFILSSDSIRFSGNRYITNKSTYEVPNTGGGVKDFVVDNRSEKVKNLSIFNQELNYYVLGESNKIESGTYELTSPLVGKKYDVEVTKENEILKISGRFMAGICEAVANLPISGDLELLDGGSKMILFSSSNETYKKYFGHSEYIVTKKFEDGTFELTTSYPALGLASATLIFKKK